MCYDIVLRDEHLLLRRACTLTILLLLMVGLDSISTASRIGLALDLGRGETDRRIVDTQLNIA